MVKVYFSSIIICIISLYGCTADDDRSYKTIAKELKGMLLELQSIDIAQTRIGDDKNIIAIDLSKQVEFVDKNKNYFDRIAKELEEYSASHKGSKWSDDAAFLRVIEYLNMSQPGNKLGEQTIDAINKFLEDYPNFEIEDWTKKYFKDVILFYIFDKEKFRKVVFNDEFSDLPERERVRLFLIQSIFNEYLLKVNDVASAKRYHEKIVHEIPYTWFLKDVEEQIDSFKK